VQCGDRIDDGLPKDLLFDLRSRLGPRDAALGEELPPLRRPAEARCWRAGTAAMRAEFRAPCAGPPRGRQRDRGHRDCDR
jgi:hypothetical protein